MTDPVRADFLRDGWFIRFDAADLRALAEALHPDAALFASARAQIMRAQAVVPVPASFGPTILPARPALGFDEIARRLVALDPVVIDAAMRHGLRRKDGRHAHFAFDDLSCPLKQISDALLTGLTVALFGETPAEAEAPATEVAANG